jgi:hypothetical protein
MMLIITPLTGWRREILVYNLNGYDPHEVFERVNALFDKNDERQRVDITLVPVGSNQVGDWIQKNIRPNAWERITGHVRYSIWKV